MKPENIEGRRKALVDAGLRTLAKHFFINRISQRENRKAVFGVRLIEADFSRCSQTLLPSHLGIAEQEEVQEHNVVLSILQHGQKVFGIGGDVDTETFLLHQFFRQFRWIWGIHCEVIRRLQQQDLNI